MAVKMDIFNPQMSVISKGLEGKSFFIYGSNSTGKTSQTVRMNKPFVIATESGLNAQSGVPFERVNCWSDFKALIRQFTSKSTVDKAREMYDTIIIDEVYAASLFCQDYIIATYGDGALTLSDGNGKVNLYQAYEKEFFKVVNTILSQGYTGVFIGHEQQKDGDKIRPFGDKRCINPIINNCDYIVYVKSNGVDEKGNVIKSSAYLAETPEFFARSRFDTTPTFIQEFTVENLTEAINKGVEAKAKATGAKLVSFEEQKAQNTPIKRTAEEVKADLQPLAEKFSAVGKMEEFGRIISDNLGVGKKAQDCTDKEVEVLEVILDEETEKAKELGLI